MRFPQEKVAISERRNSSLPWSLKEEYLRQLCKQGTREEELQTMEKGFTIETPLGEKGFCVLLLKINIFISTFLKSGKRVEKNR